MTKSRRNAWLAETPPVAVILLVLILTLSVYHQLPGYEFSNLDDDVYTYNNPYTNQGLTRDSLAWAWTKFGSPYYMPLTRISYLIDAEIFADNPGGFHLSNLLIHLLNIVLVFVICGFFFRSVWTSGFVSLLFALHPQHVEAVAWIAQRKELLAGFFGFLSLIFYLRHSRVGSRSTDIGSQSGNSLYYLSVLFFLFSLLAKPTWVMFPVLLLLVDAVSLDSMRYRDLVCRLRDKSAYLLVSVIYVAVHLYAVSDRTGHVISSVESLSLSQRLLNTGVILLDYLYRGLIPLQTTPYLPYPVEPVPITYILLAFACLIFVLWLGYRIGRGNTLFFAGLLWFLIALLPVIGVFGTGERILVGDRWTYMPHVGLFLAMGCGLEMIWRRYPACLKLTVPCVIACLCMMVYVTYSGLQYWRNSGEYWRWTISKTRDNHYAHLKLGEYYEKNSLVSQAVNQYQKAHQLRPEEYLYILRLAELYLKTDMETALYYYHKLLGTAPASLVFNLGVMFLVNDHPDRALLFFERNIDIEQAASERTVDYYLSHIYLFHLLSRKGDAAAGGHYLDRVLESLPFEQATKCRFIARELEKIETLTGFSDTQRVLDSACKGIM